MKHVFLARHEPGTARNEAGSVLARLGERAGLDRHLSPLDWPGHSPLLARPLNRPIHGLPSASGGGPAQLGTPKAQVLIRTIVARRIADRTPCISPKLPALVP
jgi:hypothetical protein